MFVFSGRVWIENIFFLSYAFSRIPAGAFPPVRSSLSVPLHTYTRYPTCTAARTTVQGKCSLALAREAVAVPDAGMEATTTSRGPWGGCLLDLLRDSRFLVCLPLHSVRQRKRSLGGRSRSTNALDEPKTSLKTSARPPHTSW